MPKFVTLETFNLFSLMEFTSLYLVQPWKCLTVWLLMLSSNWLSILFRENFFNRIININRNCHILLFCFFKMCSFVRILTLTLFIARFVALFGMCFFCDICNAFILDNLLLDVHLSCRMATVNCWVTHFGFCHWFYPEFC